MLYRIRCGISENVRGCPGVYNRMTNNMTTAIKLLLACQGVHGIEIKCLRVGRKYYVWLPPHVPKPAIKKLLESEVMRNVILKTRS